MIPYLHNAIFKVNIFLESLVSFWIMRSQGSKQVDLCYATGTEFAGQMFDEISQNKFNFVIVFNKYK